MFGIAIKIQFTDLGPYGIRGQVRAVGDQACHAIVDAFFVAYNIDDDIVGVRCRKVHLGDGSKRHRTADHLQAISKDYVVLHKRDRQSLRLENDNGL